MARLSFSDDAQAAISSVSYSTRVVGDRLCIDLNAGPTFVGMVEYGVLVKDIRSIIALNFPDFNPAKLSNFPTKGDLQKLLQWNALLSFRRKKVYAIVDVPIHRKSRHPPQQCADQGPIRKNFKTIWYFRRTKSYKQTSGYHALVTNYRLLQNLAHHCSGPYAPRINVRKKMISAFLSHFWK
jgi:hypothetical protein